MNRQRVLGAILSVWGAAILIHAMVAGVGGGSGAHRSGADAALVFGVAMVAFGTRALKRDLYSGLVRWSRTKAPRRDDNSE